MKKLFTLSIILALTACATTAVLPQNAKQAPSSRVFLYQKNEGNTAKLTVVRDSGYLGSGCFSAVYLNNKKAAILEPGEKATFNLPAGEWNVATKGEGKMCISDVIPTGRDFMLSSEQIKAVRLFADPSGNVDVKPLPLE